MSTIMYKCNYCNQVRIGMKEQVVVPGHVATKESNGRTIFKFIDRYYLCENCREYDRQKYMEVV